MGDIVAGQWRHNYQRNWYSTRQTQGITRLSFERVRTRTKTRLLCVQNAFKPGPKRVRSACETRSDKDLNAFSRHVKRVRART